MRLPKQKLLLLRKVFHTSDPLCPTVPKILGLVADGHTEVQDPGQGLHPHVEMLFVITSTPTEMRGEEPRVREITARDPFPPDLVVEDRLVPSPLHMVATAMRHVIVPRDEEAMTTWR